MELRKRGARRAPPPAIRPSAAYQEKEQYVSREQMEALQALYTSSPAIAAVREVLRGELFRGGLCLKRGGKDVVLTAEFGWTAQAKFSTRSSILSIQSHVPGKARGDATASRRSSQDATTNVSETKKSVLTFVGAVPHSSSRTPRLTAHGSPAARHTALPHGHCSDPCSADWLTGRCAPQSRS